MVKYYCCRSFSVGFEIITVSEAVPNGPGSFTKKSSGDFRYVSHLYLTHTQLGALVVSTDMFNTLQIVVLLLFIKYPGSKFF